MIRPIAFFLLVLPALTPSLIWADKWVDPMPRVFASQNGQFGLKCLEPRLLGESKGMLFTLQKDGSEKIVWMTKFPNTPHQILVSDNGRFVVTIDTWGVLGGDDSLVIYEERGKRVRNFRLEDLLTANEIKHNVKQTVSSRWWAEHATFQFLDEDLLRIQLAWGKQIRIRLNTGLVEKGNQP